MYALSTFLWLFQKPVLKLPQESLKPFRELFWLQQGIGKNLRKQEQLAKSSKSNSKWGKCLNREFIYFQQKRKNDFPRSSAPKSTDRPRPPTASGRGPGSGSLSRIRVLRATWAGSGGFIRLKQIRKK